MLVLAGLVSRTTGVSVVGSAKRTNSPTAGKGFVFLVGSGLAAARLPGTNARTARRVMPSSTSEQDANSVWLVPTAGLSRSMFAVPCGMSFPVSYEPSFH